MTASPAASAASKLEPIEIWWAAKQAAEQDRFDQLGMEVDRADETEGRLPEPRDAEAGNPEHIPPPRSSAGSKAGSRNIRGRDVTCQWLSEVQDRTAPACPSGW